MCAFACISFASLSCKLGTVGVCLHLFCVCRVCAPTVLCFAHVSHFFKFACLLSVCIKYIIWSHVFHLHVVVSLCVCVHERALGVCVCA